MTGRTIRSFKMVVRRAPFGQWCPSSHKEKNMTTSKGNYFSERKRLLSEIYNQEASNQLLRDVVNGQFAQHIGRVAKEKERSLRYALRESNVDGQQCVLGAGCASTIDATIL